MRMVWRALWVSLLLAQAAWGQPAATATGPLQERLKAVTANPAALKAAIEAGRKASFFCANCHGEDGNSKVPEVPSLAGQNPAYLLEQIRKFAAGERKDQFMQGMIKVLKDEERLQIALYFANGKMMPGRADAARVGRGKEIFARMCARCHGDQGHGNETIPRLAGQRLPYLQTTLTRFRDRTGERNNEWMAKAAAPLKNDEIAALASYLTQLP